MAFPQTTKVAGPLSTVMAELEALRAENTTLRQRADSRFTLKVSEKGAVSAYGLRRFPVTFYADEWNRIEALMPKITAFIREHADELSVKGQQPPSRLRAF